jgi:hypothetical protein
MKNGRTNVRAYNVPFRAIWLRQKDVIDLRIAGSTPSADNWTTAETVAHIAAYRLVGVSMRDHKRLGLGRWLRATGEEIPYEADEPLPAGTVRYDEAGQIAYFSIWPLLTGDATKHEYEREAKVYLLGNGAVARIRFPVMNKRGRTGVLGTAAALLATR